MKGAVDMYRSNKSVSRKRTAVAAVAATGLLATGIGVASASGAATTPNATTQSGHPLGPGPGGPGPRGPDGKISELSASSITVTSLDGTAKTYTLTSSTTVESERAAVTLADLAVGEHVRVLPSASNSTVAAEVDVVPAHVAGQVVSVSGDAIVVSDGDGFYRTINTNSSTTITKGVTSATLSDVSVGEFVGADGTVDANHTSLDAVSLHIGAPLHGLPGDVPPAPMG